MANLGAELQSILISLLPIVSLIHRGAAGVNQAEEGECSGWDVSSTSPWLTLVTPEPCFPGGCQRIHVDQGTVPCPVGSPHSWLVLEVSSSDMLCLYMDFPPPPIACLALSK